jgi:Ca2+-binding EF-hand superfamily protein
MSLVGCEAAEAIALIESHAKNDSGIVNGLTFLITIISVCDITQRNESGRLYSIFDLFDFNRLGKISQDEFTIMLICVASSYSIILDRKGEMPSDETLITATKQIYTALGKKTKSPITKQEFQQYLDENFWKKNIYGVDAMFDALLKGLIIDDEKK